MFSDTISPRITQQFSSRVLISIILRLTSSDRFVFPIKTSDLFSPSSFNNYADMKQQVASDVSRVDVMALQCPQDTKCTLWQLTTTKINYVEQRVPWLWKFGSCTGAGVTWLCNGEPSKGCSEHNGTSEADAKQYSSILKRYLNLFLIGIFIFVPSGFLVVLSFLQLLSFFSVFFKPLSETLTGARTEGILFSWPFRADEWGNIVWGRVVWGW
jgi:hypothetical protein